MNCEQPVLLSIIKIFETADIPFAEGLRRYLQEKQQRSALAHRNRK